MNVFEEKSQTDKAALIYEFNDKSPLFCRVAYNFLHEGDNLKALKILENGLKQFPNYSTALILYSLALAKTGQTSEAKNVVEKRLTDLVNKETIEHYLTKINEINDSNKRTDQISEKGSNEILANKISVNQENETVPTKETEDLDILAEKLKTASIPRITDTENYFDEPEIIEEDETSPAKNLVSETLARIYFNQGNFREALAIYEKLVEIQPELSSYYQNRIDEINLNLD